MEVSTFVAICTCSTCTSVTFLALNDCIFSDYLMLLVGSNIIKVWDILGGGRLLAGFSNHQKTITSICFDGEHRRLLSGSLDRYAVRFVYVQG